jgi:hypothetical protein
LPKTIAELVSELRSAVAEGLVSDAPSDGRW